MLSTRSWQGAAVDSFVSSCYLGLGRELLLTPFLSFLRHSASEVILLCSKVFMTTLCPAKSERFCATRLLKSSSFGFKSVHDKPVPGEVGEVLRHSASEVILLCSKVFMTTLCPARSLRMRWHSVKTLHNERCFGHVISCPSILSHQRVMRS